MKYTLINNGAIVNAPLLHNVTCTINIFKRLMSSLIDDVTPDDAIVNVIFNPELGFLVTENSVRECPIAFAYAQGASMISCWMSKDNAYDWIRNRIHIK